MKLTIEISEHNKRVIDDYVEGSGYSYKQLTRTSIIESLAQAVHKGTVFQREQRPHGEWIEVTTPELTTPETTYKAYMCSSCRTRAFINPYVYAFYCPWCGADMREKGEYKGSSMLDTKPLNYHLPELQQLRKLPWF